MALLAVVSEVLTTFSMELVMLFAAGLFYMLTTGSLRVPVGKSALSKSPKAEEDDGASVAQELDSRLAAGDYRAAFRLWQRAKSLDGAPAEPVNLVGLVRAMRALGKPDEEVVSELRSGVECNVALGQGASKLLEALRREGDSSLGLLAGAVTALEPHGIPIATSVHETIMAGHLRRRNFKELATIAARMEGRITPRMRTCLIAAAVQQSQLEEALEHLAQLPVPSPCGGAAPPLPPQAVGRLLSLALREGRLAELSAKLEQHQVSIETRSLDDLLRTTLQQKDLTACRQLWELTSSLKLPCGSQTFELLCRGLASDATALRSVYGAMGGESAPGISQEAWVALLGACVTSGDADLGCTVYEEQVAPRGVAVEGQLRSALLEAATKAGRTGMVEALSQGVEADLGKHVTMIKACGADRNIQGAKRAFDSLKKSGVQMNPLIFNCLIDACIQCGDFAAALEYFGQMKQLDFADAVSYNTVLKAHLGLWQFDEARALLREMSAQGLPANRVAFNEFLRALIAARDRRAAWALVDDMRAAQLAPDATTCSILLKSLTEHSHSSDVERTMSLLQRMGEPMDEVLFSSAAEACIRIRRLDQLSDLLSHLQETNASLALTAPCYGSMIKAYGNAGDVDHVWQLWREMSDHGVRPTSITVGCTVDALVKNGRAEDAWDLVQELSRDEEKKQYVNTVIHSTVLKGFAVARQPKRIFAVHAEMRRSGVACNTITYNTIIDACARCGCMDRVPALLEEMKTASVEPDVITYSTLVKGYCLAGDVDRAFKVLAGMKAEGKFSPDEILYNSLLDGCAKQNRVDDALRLLDDMKLSGCVPSNYTLSIMVKLLGRARRLDEAFVKVEELSQAHGFNPNVQVYTCLVQACAQNRKINKALALHETMITEAGCAPDEKFYSVLARGCLQAGALEKAAAVVRCAHHLAGHDMAISRGSPPGVEPKVKEEVLSKLGAGAAKDQGLAAQLSSDLKAAGVRTARSAPAHGSAPQRRAAARR